MIFVLSHDTARSRALDAVRLAPEGYCVRIDPPKRNLEQNAAQWPILEAFSAQLLWPVNGELTRLSAEEWKDILTAAFRKERVRIAQGLDGGVVMLGCRTSKMGKAEFSEWLDFLNATAVARGVDAAPNAELRGRPEAQP